jgi:hypothetical protein
MKKLLASVLCAALALSAVPVSLIAAAKARQFGSISGTATVDGKPLANVTVRLRNVDTKQFAGTMQADAAGNFNFTGLTAGNYVVETVGANGTILGTSTVIGLTVTALIATNVLVGTSAAALGAAGGAGAAAAAGIVGGGGGFLGLTTATALAVGVGTTAIVTTAVVVANNPASPSQ